MRKLPIYILIDTSGAMSGEPIEAVTNGLRTFHWSLRKNLKTFETAYLSLITFDSSATQMVPLTELASFKPPHLHAGGLRALGEALSLVTDCATREVKQGTAEEKGDWKPLVFILTNGIPTDDTTKGLNKFKSFHWGLVAAVAVGRDDLDLELLKSLAGENMVRLDTWDSNNPSAYFEFFSKCMSGYFVSIFEGGPVSSLSE
jgi:uncharacterized protein YegL